MIDEAAHPYDVVIIGGGPAGHNAALTAAEAGRSVLMVESESAVGGACVSRGTIPSKTLRETALSLVGFRRRSGEVFDVQMREDLQIASLMGRMQRVIETHQTTMARQMDRVGIARWHGRARFTDARTVEVRGIDGARRRVRAGFIVIATGSRPRTPGDIPVDHDKVLDSDSFLSMIYLPKSLVVLGGGVIASEYAAIFASLGVAVTMTDKSERPLGFLDPELADRFVASFTASGGRWIGKRKPAKVEWDGLEHVVTTLDDGTVLKSEKLLCALGRVANLESLDLAAAGLAATDRGLITVDASCRTAVEHIYAVGDVIGAPSLASAAMEQGRRAIAHALGLPASVSPSHQPMGIYTIPEIAAVGLSEADARKRPDGALVGRADFADLARGQIAAIPDGLLKLIADGAGKKLLGVHIIGEGAAELVHIGQMALIAGMDVDAFIANTFNFPTLAEAYRLAALDIAHQRSQVPTPA
ncbi:MAG TPA: Si-specific NAD(P)(+) transhydrogenase [Planctomycetota bacterium]|nr:Si-specific NAD(P)(+) transhydrogenase [Planctomycetota bacterium]